MADTRTVLIQCGDHFENQTRVEALSSAILAMGHKPVVLLYAPGKGDIFRRTGATVVYLNNYLRKSRRYPAESLESAVVMNVSVANLIEVEARRLPSLAWQGQLKKTLADGSRYLKAVQRLLDDVKPDRVAIWNGYTGYAANALRLLCKARGIRAAYLERGLRRDSLFIDSQGVNGASTLLRFDPQSRPDPDNTDRERLARCFPSRIPQGTALARTDGKRSILFPMQVELDTNILLYSPYSSMRQAFLAIHQQFDSPTTEFIVRPHPEEVPGQMSNIPAFERVKVTREGTLNDWIDSCDLVATINSTVGLEALLRGKPVLALGSSIYSSICPATGSGDDIDAYRVPDDRLDKYLVELCSSNLLIAGSDLNQQAVARQLDLAESGTTQWRRPATTLAEVATVTRHLDCNETIDVDVAMDPAKPLDLTYRNTRQRLDMGLLKAQLFPGIAAERIRLRAATISDHRAQVLVVDEGWRGRPSKYLAVANNYGVVLADSGQ